MRWRAVSVVVFGLILSLIGVSSVSAQSVEDQIQLLRKQIDDQQKQLQMLQQAVEQKNKEAAQQQKAQEADLQKKVETAATKALREQVELQGPAALLSPPPMPPALFNLGVYARVDFQFLNFSSVDVPFAAAQANQGSNFQARPIGPIESVGMDREFTPRFEAGFYLPGGMGVISASFQHADLGSDKSFDRSASDADDCKVAVIVSPPEIMGPFNSAIACSAQAKNKVRFDQFDLQYGYPIQVTRTFTLTPDVGMRALWFKHRFSVTYIGCDGCNANGIFDNPNAPYFSVQQSNDSFGVGPKVGLTGAWQPFPGLTFKAKGGGGWLFGDTDSDQVFCRLSGTAFSTPGCGRTHNFTSNQGGGFPFIEGDFSVGYTFQQVVRGLTLLAGYRVMSVFDLVTRLGETGGGTAQQITFTRTNLTGDAFYFGAKLMF